MIELVQGNLFTAEAEAWVNTVNCVGVMGRGIALQFAKAFPKNMEIYRRACNRGEVIPGSILIVKTEQQECPRYIFNFPTKRHWKGKSRLEDVKSGLANLQSDVTRLRITSIAIPALGCGLGGLDWTKVRPLIEAMMSPLTEVRTLIYEPTGSRYVQVRQE